MRTSLLIVLFLFVLALAAIVPGVAACAEPGTGFVTWALDRSGELDLRWNHMTDLGATKTPGSRDGTRVASERSSSAGRTVRGTELSHDILSSRTLLHKVTMNTSFLPLSTRERNGAARGVSRLQSPAKARLSMPSSVRRPLNSSIQKKNFFRTFGPSVARPKLNSFGRISRTGHRHGRGASRPSPRTSRPRIL